MCGSKTTITAANIICSTTVTTGTLRSYLLLLLTILQFPTICYTQTTPVIGGICDLGAAEVQIGGKQTQFFLKCENNQESEEGKGVWVVKSRSAASPTSIPQPSTTLPPANTEPQQHPKQLHKQQSIICAQELNAREADSCTAPATCLQLNSEDASTFLQCDQSNNRWVKKSCSDGNVFSFEQQACTPSAKAPNRHYARYSSGSQGVVCTFTQCSNSNPCNQGTCNNGYCCTSGSSSSPIIHGKTLSYNNKTLLDRTTDFKLVSNDWPVGPPGFGFPPELANLDSILVKASGDGRVCAAGFQSTLKCSENGECPPGLFCDPPLSLCCPLILPISDKSNPADHYTHPKRLSPKSYGSYPISSSPCPGCSSFSGGQVVAIPSYSAPSTSSSSSSLCTAGCPRGYSGCCGTQQASCCLRQQCPGGLPSTGRSCFRSCPSGQVCVSGVCCPQLTCPSGGQPYGSCINGYCSPGYQCMQSTGMCCPAAQRSYVQVCPMGGTAMGNCVSGSCSQGYTCMKSTNLCCPSATTNPFVCPDGTQAVGACINGVCGAGFSCTNGLCCNGTSQNPRCLDGSAAVGACINGRCGSGYICTTGNICCSATLTSTCPNGATPIGTCVNDLCPDGYTCINNNCCPTSATAFTCDANAVRAGPCINDACPEGLTCDTSIDQCCPSVPPIGPCIGGVCPDGYTCYPDAPAAGVEPQCYTVCNGNANLDAGPAQANGCPAQTVMILNHCCLPARYHRSPSRRSALIKSYSEPLPGMMNMSPLESCPGGTPAVSGCMNGLCGAGFECINDLCCAYVAQNAVIFAASATRPIGAACDYSEQCVGFSEGLSTCEIGNCRCLPIAYTQGIACVRRKAFSLKFNDAVPVENVESNVTTTTATPTTTSAVSSEKHSEQQRPSKV